MRVVHICDGFLPLVGGSTTHNYSAVRYLSGRGHSVEVITFIPEKTQLSSLGYGDDIYEKLKSGSYTLPELDRIRIRTISSKQFRWYYDLWKEIKMIENKGKVDVFDVHLMHYAVPLLNRKNVVLSVHYWEPVCPYMYFPEIYRPDYFLLRSGDSSKCFRKCADCVGRFQYFKWKLLRQQAMRTIARYIVKKPYYREPMESAGIVPGKIKLIPFWIDTENIRHRPSPSNRSTYGISASDKVFAFVGRLEDAKGPFLALHAFLLLQDGPGRSVLLFFGDGSLREPLESFCRIHKLSDSVRFFGRVPHPEIYDHFSLVDVFLHTERYEYGWALLECMATGKPVVGLSVGKAPEILKDGFNAFLAEPTPESLCEKMKRAVVEPELSKKVGERSLNVVRTQYSLRNLERYETVLQEVASECARR